MVVVDGIYLAEQETKIRFHSAKKKCYGVSLYGKPLAGDFKV